MAMRNLSWTAVAAAIFLAGCDNQLTFPEETTDSYVATSANRLVGINRAAPGSIRVSLPIGGLTAGESVADVAFRPNDGLLYALVVNGTSGRIVTLDQQTGAATAVSTLTADATDATEPFAGLNGTSFGIDFNPVPDRLRVISNTGQNLRINVATGATITDGALNGAGTSATSTAYTNAFNAACRTMQFAIDPATDTLFQQNPPNAGTLVTVGGLGVDVTSTGGFDVATSAAGGNTAQAVFNTATGVGLYTVNTATGAATLVGTIGLNAGETARGFATRSLASTPTQAAGDVVGLSTSGQLVSFNRGAPAKTCTRATVSGIPTGTTVLGIDVRPASGQIVALGSDNTLYTIGSNNVAAPLCPLVTDPTDVTLPFSALPAGASYGVGFNPVPDRLRVTTSTGLNLRINANPNAAGQCLVITDTAISGATAVTGAAYTNSIAGAGSTALYGIDSGADTLVRIGNDPANGVMGDPGNPNSGVATTIGSLGIGDVGSTDAFLIDNRSNSLLLATGATGATASTFYTVDIATGAATSAGTVGGGAGTAAVDPLIGMVQSAGNAVRIFALTTDNTLLSFTQANNAFQPNAVTSLPITGLTTGEELLGIDLRPANGTLYAVSSLGRVLVINTSTGVATLSSMLAADATDTTAPFVALAAGATFGIDFNPVPDRLRVVDTNGNNLRINVATGGTLTDGVHNGAATTGVLAAAYTNSFAGTTSTTLYNLDASQLFTQVPPNDGTLVLVGNTGVTAVGDVGFDIAGGANGLALAAISPAAGPSNLYRINLTTGAATALGVAGGTARIGAPGAAQVRSIAIDVR